MNWKIVASSKRGNSVDVTLGNSTRRVVAAVSSDGAASSGNRHFLHAVSHSFVKDLFGRVDARCDRFRVFAVSSNFVYVQSTFQS